MKTKALTILLSLMLVFSLGAIIPPPAQASPEDNNFVPPIITHPDEIDKDFNGIEDALESKITTCSKDELEEPIAVIVILKQPYTETDLDSFLSASGEIKHKYERVTYGFSGSIPLSKINELAESLGDKLNIIEQDRPTEASLDVSTQIIRVRNTVWNTYGYRGDPNSAIAVIDSGIDDSHTDLSGYQDAAGGWPAANIKVVGWDDEIGTTTSPVDYNGHGTHTASTAAGTGASIGSGTITQLTTTFFGKLSYQAGYYTWYSDRIKLPTTGTINLNMAWQGTGTALVDCYDTTGTLIGMVTSSTSPITQNYNATVAGIYGPCSGNSNSAGLQDQPFSTLETYPYADVGDGENLFTGVAPETRLVGVRVFPGIVGDLIAGYEWVVANKNTYRIKVATSSITLGVGNTDSQLRNAANTMVTNGIVFTVSADNYYPDYTIGDPGLASKVITVGATNDEDGITDYSSNGGAGSNKPDVAAPGGSSNVASKITAADTNDCDGEVSTFTDRNANDYTNMQGTSMSTPHVGGLAALVIQAMEDKGLTWTWSETDALKVKSIILMTAGETNNAVHPGESSNDPPLNRGTNDLVEGYGRINADAAIEAVTMSYTIGTTAQDTLGQNPTNKRVWARQVSLTGGQEYTFSLTVPAGADFDLYLYDGTAGTDGTPVILEQSTAAATGGTETITYTPPSSTNAYIVVKWVSGSGQFSLDSAGGAPPDTTPPYTSGHAPASGATDVPVGTNIVVHVLDAGDGVDIATIAMTVEGASETPVITGTPADYTLTYDPTVDFAYLQVVDVTINASDLASPGNAMTPDAYSFTTEPDTTPPDTPVVTDDGDWTNSNSQLHATWTASDPESGIAEYQYGIGTTLGDTDIVPWTSTGTNTGVTKTGLSLTDGQTYYFTVKAQNGAGLWSNPGNSNGITVDTTGPMVTINQAVGQADPTNTSPINFTVVFSESVDDFGGADVTLSGTAGATTAVVSGNGTTYNVAVSGMASDGTVIASINAGVAHDAAGNGNDASTSTDNEVTYGTTGPTVTINQAAGQADPTNTSPINFDMVFSESVDDFDSADVTLSSGSATVTGSGTTYDVSVSGMSEGVLTASIAAGVAHDAAGNPNYASTSTDNQVTYDTTPPGAPTLVSPANHTFTNDNTVDLDWSDAAGASQYQVQADDNADFSSPEYDSGWIGSSNVTTSALADGTYYWQARGRDAASNAGNWSSENWDFTVDTTPPTDPTDVTSPSHTVSTWSIDNTVVVTWTDATDADSGLDGYSILWDTTSDTIPPTTLNMEDGIETATSAPLADGNSHYFHISSVDNAGNWQSTVHLGPFFIDTIPPVVTVDIPDYINAANETSVPVTITSDEDGTYSYTISDVTPAHDVTGTGPITSGVPVNLSLNFSGLDEGPVTADASVADAAANVGNAPQDTATKDTAAPTVPTNLDAPAYVNTVNEAAYMVTGDTETDSTVEVRITDGTITVTNTGTATGGAFSIAVDCSTLADGTDNIDIDAKATDAAGNESAYSTAIVRSKDAVLPTDPTDVTSSSHTVSTWSIDNTVVVTWTDATDADSGLDGYSILWDTTPDTIPPTTLNMEDGIETATSAPLADGNSHYFHISSVDNAGNWQSTVHLGPFFIDTIPPAGVTDLAAGNPTRTSMELTWTAPGDDADTGTASTYDIRYSTSLITGANWDSANQCTGEPAPSAAGSIETFTVNGLSDLTPYYFALKTADKVPSWSDLSNVASGTTQNRPPVLSNGAVSPTSGYTSTTFTYSVTYTDADNDPPASPMVSIDDGLPEDMAVKAGDGDYINGEIYEYTVSGSDLGRGSHAFQFAASDGIDDATGDIEIHDGPTVRSSGGGGGGGGGGRDTRAPVISNIECSDCTKASIIIKWRTGERGTSRVEYWASEHMFSPLDETLVLSHEVELINLKPCCVYHFRTISKDSSGNEAISEEDTFTTLGTPAAFTISSLSISPAEVKVGESMTVSALVTNTGDATSTYAATLKIDNVVVAIESVTLAGGAIEEVTFTTSRDVAGTYTVSVDGQSGTVVVKAPAAFTISALAISPAKVDTGEDVTVSALVTNTGDTPSTYEVIFKIDNVVVATKSVTLAGGASEEVTFITSKDVAGTYTVDLNGLPGTFVVKAGLSWWLIGGIIAAVVAAGLLVYFYVWRKRGVSRLT